MERARRTHDAAARRIKMRLDGYRAGPCQPADAIPIGYTAISPSIVAGVAGQLSLSAAPTIGFPLLSR